MMHVKQMTNFYLISLIRCRFIAGMAQHIAIYGPNIELFGNPSSWLEQLYFG